MCWYNDFRHQDSVFTTRTTGSTFTHKYNTSFLNYHITSKLSRRLLRKYRFKNKGHSNPIRNLLADPCTYHLLISGYHKIRNQQMRAVNGNTVTLNLEQLLPPTYTYSRADMLAVRQTVPLTSNLSFSIQPRPSNAESNGPPQDANFIITTEKPQVPQRLLFCCMKFYLIQGNSSLFNRPHRLPKARREFPQGMTKSVTNKEDDLIPARHIPEPTDGNNTGFENDSLGTKQVPGWATGA